MPRLTPFWFLLLAGLGLQAHADDPPRPDAPVFQDDEPRETEKEGEEGVDATVRDALEELLAIEHKLKAGNVIAVTYPFSEGGGDLADFDSNSFDRLQVGMVDGWSRFEEGLELGAGSRRMGTLMHRLYLTGDFTITVKLWVNHNTPSTVICFLLSKKVGVKWGQIVVKPKNLRPYNRRARADATVFKEEKLVTIEMAFKGKKLTVKCNGRKTDERTFKKGELNSVRFGLMARNTRLVLTDLKIVAEVDVSKL